MSFEVTVAGAAFAEAAHWAAGLAPALSSQPLLGGVLLVADNSFDGAHLSFSATDNDTTGRITVAAAQVVDGGRRLVSARLLAAIARTVAKEPEVTLVDHGDDRRLDVHVGAGAGWSLPLLPAEDYPRLPTPTTPVARVNAVAFARATEQASMALDDPKLPPFFGGVVLDGDDECLSVVTGSRYRIGVAELAWQPAQSQALSEHPGFTPVLVPNLVLSAALRAASGVTDDDELLLHSDGLVFAVSGPGFHIIGRVGAEGRWSEWRAGDMISPKLLKNSFGHVDVVSASLRTALDRVAVALNTTGDAVAVEVTEDGEMSVSGLSEERGSAAHPVEIRGRAGRPCRYGIKLAWARDIVAALGTEIIRLEFLGKPGAANTLARGLDEHGEADPRVRLSVAPIRLTAPVASAA